MSDKLLEEFLEFIERIEASKGGHVSASVAAGQNIAEAIRPVFFITNYEEFLYATHGGTLFLVEFEGKLYGLTCQHLFKDFPREQLFVVNEKFAKKGCPPARIKGFWNPASPKEGAEGTDITDLCVIEFADNVTQEFFQHSAYIINDVTVGTAREGDALLVAGVLKDKTNILEPDIEIGYCRLQFHDAGVGTSDPFLREAITEFANPEFENIVGISGSPVFDSVQSRLCGMVMRGGMKGRRSSIHYLDISDIVQTLRAVRSGAMNTNYTKVVLVRPDVARRKFVNVGDAD